MKIYNLASKTVLLLLIAVLTATPALARETNPGPGFFTWLFGGQVQFKKLGITIVIEYSPPAEFAQYMTIKPDGYVWENGTKIPVGSKIRLSVLVDTARKKNSGVPTTIEVSQEGQGWNPLVSSSETWIQQVFDTSGRSYGPLAFRVYSDGGDDRDNHEIIIVYLESRESVYQRLGIAPPLAADYSGSVNDGLPETRTLIDSNVPTGTVVIKIDDGFANKPRYIKVFSNGTLVAAGTVTGIQNFNNVPVGEISLSIERLPGDDSHYDWTLKGMSTTTQQLMPNGTVKFNLVRGEVAR